MQKEFLVSYFLLLLQTRTSVLGLSSTISELFKSSSDCGLNIGLAFLAQCVAGMSFAHNMSKGSATCMSDGLTLLETIFTVLCSIALCGDKILWCDGHISFWIFKWTKNVFWNIQNIPFWMHMGILLFCPFLYCQILSMYIFFLAKTRTYLIASRSMRPFPSPRYLAFGGSHLQCEVSWVSAKRKEEWAVF